jgi:hypothetical protein
VASTGKAVRLERGVLAAGLRRAGADAAEASRSFSVVRFLVMLVCFGISLMESTLFYRIDALFIIKSLDQSDYEAVIMVLFQTELS